MQRCRPRPSSLPGAAPLARRLLGSSSTLAVVCCLRPLALKVAQGRLLHSWVDLRYRPRLCENSCETAGADLSHPIATKLPFLACGGWPLSDIHPCTGESPLERASTGCTSQSGSVSSA